MKKCINCNVTILDETSVCPLCRQVLQRSDEEPEYTGNVYPDLSSQNHIERLFANIIFFLSLVGEGCMITFWLLTDRGFNLCLIIGMGLIYLNVILRMSIIGKSEYSFKIVSIFIFSFAVLFGVDFVTGNRGWSMEFVYPAGMLLYNLCIGILMIVNRRNWQSYMVMQLIAIVLSMLPVILLLLDIVHFPYLIVAAISVSAFFFLGTLIIGDYRARTELKRRFHI